MLVLVPIFIALGMWQWDRFEERSAATQRQEANASAEPVPFAELTEVGGNVSEEDRWRASTATGHYDTEHEFLVRHRSTDGGPGFYVVTPLVSADGDAVLVNRGWVPQEGAATDGPDVPEPPGGEVTVTGNAQFAETEENTGIRDRGGLPEGQIMLINSDVLAEQLPYPVYGGHLERTSEDPAPESAPMALEPSGYNYGLNAAYAVQWWVFALIAIGGWCFLVRRELYEHRRGGTSPGGDEDPGSHTRVQTGASLQ
uniref:SURF1 family cytochrome oxidase biogenesis protein n=1 Tax=Lipingzhangella rawalii TaxID=2055835 RepID=UPI00287BA05E|nr:SURF1 family protein [Lipingzhangella rawalii]